MGPPLLSAFAPVEELHVTTYALSHLTDQVLLRDLAALVARDRNTTAALLAHLAEVDARRLYLPAGYPSMYAYCVDELRLSEDAAYKRIQAARAARQFRALFTALAEGRLHLTAVCLLAPHPTLDNADELVAAAAHQRKSEIERLLAQRFPRPELLAMVEAIPAPPSLPTAQLAPGQVGAEGSERAGAFPAQLAPGQVGVPALRPKVAPLAPQRFALQLTMGQEMHDDLRYAQELLGHEIPSGDVTEVLHRALKALIGQLEKRKFAATSRPRPRQRRGPARGRYIPAEVKRAVWERDGGRCTFVSEAGHRCPARKLLEFDHIDPVARGGQATIDRMRLRCRAHNQYGAEQTFGTEFMNMKRQAAQCAAAEARAPAAAEEARAQVAAAKARAQALAAKQAQERDVIPWCESSASAPTKRVGRRRIARTFRTPHSRNGCALRCLSWRLPTEP